MFIRELCQKSMRSYIAISSSVSEVLPAAACSSQCVQGHRKNTCASYDGIDVRSLTQKNSQTLSVHFFNSCVPIKCKSALKFYLSFWCYGSPLRMCLYFVKRTHILYFTCTLYKSTCVLIKLVCETRIKGMSSLLNTCDL